MDKINISTEFIKLDSFMKFAGMSPDGASAKQVIQAGFVKVNGEVCTQRGKKLRPGDIVEIGSMSYEVVSD